jgi:hypothetical protein
MTQAFNLSQLANYVNTSGQLNGATGISGTVPSATTANAAGSIANAGGWNITPSGTTLFFNYNGTNVGKLTSAGTLTVLGNIVSNGTI